MDGGGKYQCEPVRLKYYSADDMVDGDGYMGMPDPSSGHWHVCPVLFSGTSWYSSVLTMSKIICHQPWSWWNAHPHRSVRVCEWLNTEELLLATRVPDNQDIAMMCSCLLALGTTIKWWTLSGCAVRWQFPACGPVARVPVLWSLQECVL